MKKSTFCGRLFMWYNGGMRKKLFAFIAGVMIMMGAIAPTRAFALGLCAEHSFFGLDPWYAGLQCEGKDIADVNFRSDALAGTVLTIAGTVVRDLLFVAGFAVILLIVYGGFTLMTSQGNPSGVEKGRKIITNAVIGLVIVAISYGIITVLFKILGAG